jgi:hypothetical protein
MSQHVTALELATYFNGTTDLDELTPEWIAQANILLQMIAADVEAAAGVPLDAEAGTVILGGSWSRDLLLPAGPIRDVTAVTVNGVALAASAYYYNERSLLRRGFGPLDELEESDDLLDLRQGAQMRDGSYWSGPAATVIVDYSWGFETVPDWIKSLELRVAARTFGNVANVTQESLAIYSVTYGQSTSDDGSHLTRAERFRLRKMLNRTAGTIAAASL